MDDSKGYQPDEEKDCGLPPEEALRRAHARIRQLRTELAARQQENETIMAENLRQNEALRSYGEDLGTMVKMRTWELEVSKHKLELQARKLKELGETKEALMHMIVHDMKNPLAAVLGTLKLFQRNAFEMTPDAHELLQSAHGQALKLLSMIEDILVVSRMQSKEFQIKAEPSAVTELVRRSLAMMEKTLGERSQKLRCDPTAEPLTVSADTAVIERVLNNLLNNAMKYAPRESEITVTSRRRDRQAVISVINWGDPIPAEYQQKVFDMFCRVKGETCQFTGTGLGLTFCKLAVEAHGGTIWVESPVPPEDHGACFSFTLPLVK